MANMLTQERKGLFEAFVQKIEKDGWEFEEFLRKSIRGKKATYQIRSTFTGYAYISPASAYALLEVGRISAAQFSHQLKENLRVAGVDELFITFKKDQNPAINTLVFLEESAGKFFLKIQAQVRN